MEKKAVWITLIVLSVLFVIQIPFNLHSNAYYYATHTHQRKNQYPFVTLLDSNYLSPNYVPGYKVQNEDRRGSYQVTIRRPDGKSFLKLKGFAITYYRNGTDDHYYLKDFYVISFSRYGIINGKAKDGRVPSKAENFLYSNLEKIQSEIKNNTSKPLINIQWIWDFWFKIH